ncbi:MAG: lipoprotein [Chloroflexota bacterium]
MKRPLILFSLALLLAGCSMPDLSYILPAVEPTSTLTVTPSPTRTLAPGETRLPTDTPTLTDTPTETPVPPTATSAFTPTYTKRPTITLPPPDMSAFTPGSMIITSILVSGDTIRWGACGGVGPFEVKFTVRVAKTKNLYYVLLFLRLQDKYSWLSSDWFGGAIMQADSAKTVYTYTITKENITNYQDYDEAWLQYQVVATTSWRAVLGRSLVYLDKISVVHCATPTPKP